MMSVQVEILSKKMIKPSNPSPNHLQKFKLSLFDQLAARVYPGIVYYYSGGGDENTANNTAQKCAELEKSLSKALGYLYPFAGRFMKDDVSIDCSDQGAELWHARVSCKLSEFLQGGPEIELVDKLLPWEIPPALDSATSPQLAIQVNTFDDGGIVVGVRISHILADAATTSLFMDTWATACRGGATACPIPFGNFNHDVADAFPAILSSSGFNHPLSLNIQPGNEDKNKILTRRFLISSTLLTRCTKRSNANAMASCEKQPSRVVLALALVWKALMGTAVAKHGYMRDSVLSIPMNLRGKVSLAMRKTRKAFGNFYISVLVPFVANKAYNDVDLYDLIILIKNTIADTHAKIASASRDDLMTMVLNSREVVAKRSSSNSVDVYFCSSWYGALPVYETDFGWGKPMWSSICTQPGPGVCLMDSCEEDGIELWVSLKQEEMLSFKRQFYILASISNL